MEEALEAMEMCLCFADAGKCNECSYARVIRRVRREEIRFLNEMLVLTCYQNADPDTVKFVRELKGKGMSNMEICKELNIAEGTLKRMLRVKPPFRKVVPRKVKKAKRGVNDGR
jgi:hypothetical protein